MKPSGLTRSPCKRIVRIESIAEDIIRRYFADYDKAIRKIDSPKTRTIFASAVLEQFRAAISAAISDPEVVGFKSVICYRTGLAVPSLKELANDGTKRDEAWASLISRNLSGKPTRLEHDFLNPFFLHVAAELIQKGVSATQHRKPLQLHTGLGDNDISLRLSNPSYLQPFIEEYPNLPIVLLHASYPFTREAGYLASVYENVYLDIGEVFPMVSPHGQEKVVAHALELCPSEKLTWSTDGHWFPETYLLAVIQIREALERVLSEYVEQKSLEAAQAIRIVEDLLFRTSNRLYELNLPLTPFSNKTQTPSQPTTSTPSWTKDLATFETFLAQNPSIAFIRLQWLDYTSTSRVRLLPTPRALSLFRASTSISLTAAVLGLLQTDNAVPGFSAVGACTLIPCFSSLRLGYTSSSQKQAHYATLQCEFRTETGDPVPTCPRTALRTVVSRAQHTHALTFLIGFEVEVVFMSQEIINGEVIYGSTLISPGHGWSTTRALHDPTMLSLLETILAALARANIGIQQFHPEAASGQYEFVLDALPPLEAVDTLLAARDIIAAAAAAANLRATFVPKPLPHAAGSGAHIHLSLSPEGAHESFYAGILKHLRAIAAFAYPNASSYERAGDSVWAGGRWVAWGTQNREAPLRKIERSHWEFKAADGLANMYLVLAALLGAGVQGIADAEELAWRDFPVDPAGLDEAGRAELGIRTRLPGGLEEALGALEADEGVRAWLGEGVVGTFLSVKRAEAEMLGGMEEGKRRNWLIERY